MRLGLCDCSKKAIVVCFLVRTRSDLDPPEVKLVSCTAAVNQPPQPAALCASSPHDAKQHTVHETLPSKVPFCSTIFTMLGGDATSAGPFQKYDNKLSFLRQQKPPMNGRQALMWLYTSRFLAPLTFCRREIKPSKRETH